MREIMYNRALFILHKKHRTLTLSRRHRTKIFDSHSKENHFVASKMLNFLIIVLFTRKPKIFVLSYSTLRIISKVMVDKGKGQYMTVL